METSWIIFLLVNVVLALTVSIFGNFATGWVRVAYDKSVFSSRKKRIEALLDEYKGVVVLKENHELLIAFMIRDVANGLFNLGILIVQVAIDILVFRVAFTTVDAFDVWVLILAIVVLYVIFRGAGQEFNRVGNRMHNVINFDSYTEKTKAKLKKLGGNPEELDKIGKVFTKVIEPVSIEKKS